MKKKLFPVVLALALLAFILIVPFDVCRNGFFYEVPPVEEVPTDGAVSLQKGTSVDFVPAAKYLSGFVVMFEDIPDNYSGEITVSLYDASQNLVDTVTVSGNTLKSGQWFGIYLNSSVKKIEPMSVVFLSSGADAPGLIREVETMRASETQASEIMIGYAYAESTFTPYEKAFFSMLLLGALAFLASVYTENKKAASLKRIALFLVLTTVLAWNYTYNTIDKSNTTFDTFQKDSEALVTDVITAKKEGLALNKYGLGTIKDQYLEPYEAQFGLHGKLFRHIADNKIWPVQNEHLNFLCSVLTAVVFTSMVFLLNKKYGVLYAACFYLTFWLSPWVVNFARNLYWLEFTWFAPMLVGLYCSMDVTSQKRRLFCYALTFSTILVKCLCGYEYISSIMMGLVAFLVFDFFAAATKNRKEQWLIARTIIILGLVALAGFFTAIVMHAGIRSNGSILEGIKTIYEGDVLRRTSGGQINDFSAIYYESFNASAWEVICKYFTFSTEIITGIRGNLFPLLSITPLVLFAYEYKNQKLDWVLVSQYLYFMLTAVSWFTLAKSHSYIHTHMNFVLWYFGFVQICIYITVKHLKDYIELRESRP